MLTGIANTLVAGQVYFFCPGAGADLLSLLEIKSFWSMSSIVSTRIKVFLITNLIPRFIAFVLWFYFRGIKNWVLCWVFFLSLKSACLYVEFVCLLLSRGEVWCARFYLLCYFSFVISPAIVASNSETNYRRDVLKRQKRTREYNGKRGWVHVWCWKSLCFALVCFFFSSLFS